MVYIKYAFTVIIFCRSIYIKLESRTHIKANYSNIKTIKVRSRNKHFDDPTTNITSVR